MDRNEAIAIVGCGICIAAMFIFGPPIASAKPCTCSAGLIHDSLKPSDKPVFTNMTLPRIENGLPIGGAPGGVTTNTGPIFATNRMTLPDADVGARPGDTRDNSALVHTDLMDAWYRTTNSTFRARTIAAVEMEVGPITNTYIQSDPVWIPVAGLREKLTLSNPVVRAVIKMDRNKMITVELEHVTTNTGLERWVGSTNSTMRRVQ